MSHLQGACRREEGSKLSDVTAVVGEALLSSWVVVTVTNTTITRTEHERDATSTWTRNVRDVCIQIPQENTHRAGQIDCKRDERSSGELWC